MTNLSKPSILTIIVTYNGAEWVSKCISSIEKSTVESDIFVVDNNSTDDTINIIRAHHSSVKLISLSENIGFGGGNNMGLKEALESNYDYAFLLNQDAWVKEDTLAMLIQAQRKEPEFGIVSPIHLNKDGSKLELLFSQFIEPSKCPNLYSDIYVGAIKHNLYQTAFVNAAAWLISQDCLKTIGGFSPIFYHYGEDDNYCLRANYHHVKIGICAKAEIYHAKENYTSDLELHDEMLKRQKIVLYSDPARFHLIDNEIHIQYMASLKSLLKMDFKNYKLFINQYRYLKNLKSRIADSVSRSTQKGPNFIK
jgi:GT2 family glycosyltransferase